jgi:hypothetical protein
VLEDHTDLSAKHPQPANRSAPSCGSGDLGTVESLTVEIYVPLLREFQEVEAP